MKQEKIYRFSNNHILEDSVPKKVFSGIIYLNPIFQAKNTLGAWKSYLPSLFSFSYGLAKTTKYAVQKQLQSKREVNKLNFSKAWNSSWYKACLIIQSTWATIYTVQLYKTFQKSLFLFKNKVFVILRVKNIELLVREF